MLEHITDHITAIGVSDTEIDLFESQYTVPFGVTYNSYLVSGTEACAVMDSVDSSFTSQWLENIADALGNRMPDYLVVLHMEPDHSGSIADAMEAFPAMKLVLSAKAADMLPQFFADAPSWARRIITVGENSTLDLGGGIALTFLTAPMVHWPEVLVAWESASATLFSADAFGTFGTPGHFEPWAPEAARYYFNICGKYGAQTKALLAKAAALPAIERACPLHGPVLHGPALAEAIRLYTLWSASTPDIDGVLVPYASIYGHTASAAAALAMMLEERGVQATMIDLARCDVSEAVSLAFRHKAICLAAASYDASVFPPMATFLHHLSLKALRNRPVALIQNGTWAPSANRAMRAILDGMKEMTILQPELTIRTRLSDADYPLLTHLADNLAEAVLTPKP